VITSAGLLVASLLASAIPFATPKPVTSEVSAPPIVRARLLTRAPATYHELAAGSIVSLDEVASIAFATPEIGYALGGPVGYQYPLKTTDAGRRWTVDGSAFFLPTADAPASVSEIVATNSSEAFAYGGPGGGSSVDVSTDGGAQWWSSYLGQGLMAVAARGSDLWALAAGSFSSSRADAVPPVWLYDSSDGGRTWRYKSSLDGVLGWEADLVRPSASSAFALVKAFRNDVPSDEHLITTSNGGRRWTTRTDPCNTRFSGYAVDWTERLMASSANSLWLLCGSQPSTGTQVKLVERSTDGGRTWSLVASHAPGEHVPPNDIPLVGELPDSGTTGDLLVGSASTAWLILLGNNVLLVTRNGGRDWTDAAPTLVEEQFPQQFSRTGTTMLVKTQNALWSERDGTCHLVVGSSSPY
jgi:photosystem II stability/assembly factor-like uncharacterized protein